MHLAKLRTIRIEALSLVLHAVSAEMPANATDARISDREVHA